MAKAQRPRRIDVKIDGMLRTSDGITLRVRVLDLSARGFRIEHCDHVFVGERVVLGIGTEEPVAAEIKWTLGREAGGTFMGSVPEFS